MVLLGAFTGKHAFPALIAFLLLTSSAATQHGKRDSSPPSQAEPEVRVSSRPYVPGAPPSDALLVPVSVAVRDAHGHAVSGLKVTDFQVTDQGKEVTLAGLSQIARMKADAAPSPRTIALCFDDYGATPEQLMRAKFMAVQFVKEGLGPADRVSVSSTSSRRLTDFTSDKQKLISAIERLEKHATPTVAPDQKTDTGKIVFDGPVLMTKGDGNIRDAVASVNSDVRAADLAAGLTASADSAVAGEFVSQAFLELIASYDRDLAHLPGSRAIVLFSPGFAGTSPKDESRVIDQTLNAGVVINTVDCKDGFRERSSPESEPTVLPASLYNFEVTGLGPEASMAELARSTGGLFFHHNSDRFSHGYHELGDAPEVSYVLAVPPEEGDKYRRLTVQLKSPGSNLVEARSGYFPPPKGAAAEAANLSALRPKLDAQVVSMKTIEDFPFSVGLGAFEKLPSGKTKITVMLHADLKDLPFAVRDNRHTQMLTLVAAIFDEHGKMVSAKEGLMEFALTDAKYNSIKGEGVGASLVLEAGPGLYRLCTVGQDIDGKMASTLNKITVP
jgi:VWFA-related protein